MVGGQHRSEARHAGWSVAAAFALALVGCSDAADSPMPPAFGTDRSTRAQQRFSPGAAAPLSIMGTGAEMAGDPFDAAVQCAAALEVTLATISQMQQVGDDQKEALRQAQGLFRTRADRLARETPASQAIATRVEQVQDNPATQVQLAVSCLRQGAN